MKAGSGQHFEQCHNAQAAVEVESRLIVGQRVSQSPNDKQELVPTVASIPAEAGRVAAVLTDNGFFSEAAVKQIEQIPEGTPTGTTVYAPLDKDEPSSERGRLGAEGRTGAAAGGRQRD
jgi:hypothetical protein